MTRPKINTGSSFFFDTEAWRGSVRVQRMTAEERGLYLEMLIEQWLKGTAPGSPDACERRIGVAAVERWRAAWPRLSECFEQRVNGQLINPKLAAVKKNKLLYLSKKIEAGRLGGKRTQAQKLRGKHRSSTAQAPLKRSDLDLDLTRSDQIRDQDQDQRLRRDPVEKSVENSDPRYRVILKIAHETIDAFPTAPYADLVEGVKELCSKRRIPYGSAVVHKAVDSALATRDAKPGTT